MRISTVVALVCALVSLTSTVAAQTDASNLKPRELFYSPVVPTQGTGAASSNPTPKPKVTAGKHDRKSTPKSDNKPIRYMGLRYSVVQLDLENKTREVDPDQLFRTGDRIRLRVMPNTAGFLYVLHQGSSGSWEILFPSREFSATSASSR